MYDAMLCNLFRKEGDYEYAGCLSIEDSHYDVFQAHLQTFKGAKETTVSAETKIE